MRKLDAAITEALGYEVEWWEPRDVRLSGHKDYYLKDSHRTAVPHYSTDGNDMLLLDKEMRERGWELELHKSYLEKGIPFRATYRKVVDGCWVRESSHNPVEPLARALAAYKALTGEEYTNGLR